MPRWCTTGRGASSRRLPRSTRPTRRPSTHLSGWDRGLVARFDRAAGGDAAEADVLVADGVLAAAAVEGRVTVSTPAIDAVVDQAESIERRVNGALVLVVDPPVGC